MSKKIQVLALFAVLLSSTAVFAADTFKIDPAHSSFSFSVRHMMISNVPGEFDTFSGQITYSPTDVAASTANLTIETASINTRNDKRDAHLKSPDFFDAAKYPAITFVSTKFTAAAITGNLTMKGVTKEITIPVTIAGPVKTMKGGQSIGITGSVVINRQDFGVSWNKALDQGGWVVANDVNVSVSIEADEK
jgi:polyisoprenoid-binding protein YceI